MNWIKNIIDFFPKEIPLNADNEKFLPEIVVENKGKIPNSYYKVFLEPYQKKWKIK